MLLDVTKANMNGYTVSGGFATVQPNSVLSINAVEGYALEDFSADVSGIALCRLRRGDTANNVGRRP